MKNFLYVLAIIVSLPLAGRYALAQSYPNKPLRLSVGFPAGVGTDITARILAPYLAEGLGQPVIVDNKPGLGGVLSASEVTKAAPDGYTLCFTTTSSIVTGPYLMDRPPYDPVRSFTPIGQIAEVYFAGVVPHQHPANSLKEFAAWAKANANAGKVNYASVGSGSVSHLVGAQLDQIAGLRMTHVPYKGSIVADLMSGRIQISFALTSTVAPLVQSGKLKALAVTSSARYPDLPNVPTVREAGYPALEFVLWQGLLAPAETPKEVIGRLSAELKRIVVKAELRERFAKVGNVIAYRGPEEFSALIKADVDRWLPVIKSSGAKFE